MTLNSFQLFGFNVRPLMKSDITEKYLSWLQDEEVTRFLGVDAQDYLSINQLYEYFDEIDNYKKFLFGVFKDKKHVGNFTVNSIDYKNGIFDIGYFIGDKSYWGSKAGEVAIVCALKFAFENLGLRKIFGGILEPNISARLLAKKIGFIQEGILKDRVRMGDNLVNSMIVTMDSTYWSNECRNKYDFR